MSLIISQQTGSNHIGMTGVTMSLSTPRMTTDGLMVFLDAANPKSYVSGQTTWNDISGNRYHFTLTGNTTDRPTFSGSNYGYINFNQTSTNFTWAERTPTFPRLTAYTIEVWVKFNSSVANTSSVITTIYNGSINFTIGWNGSTNQRLIYGGRFSGFWINTDSGFVPSLEEWYQIVLTFDLNSGIQNLFLNSNLYSSNYNSTTANISGGIRIARRWDSGTANDFTNMSASVVRIYNRALTQSEINNNYQSLSYRYRQNIPSIDYILDSYPNAVVAYSVRKLRSSYSGYAMRLIRSSDNQTLDVPFSGKDLDNVSLKNFLTGDTIGYVSVWYDQSGNGNNATGTTGNYPSITRTSYISDKYSLFFDSTYDNSFSLRNVTTARSVFMVLHSYDTNSLNNYGGSILGNNNNSYNYLAGRDGQWLYVSSPDNIKNGTNYINGYPTDFTITYKDVGSKYLTLLHRSSTGTFNRISINNNVYKSWYGRMSEVIVYSGDQKNNRLVIEKNISEYYSIFPNS
jgi:hypothetical protein